MSNYHLTALVLGASGLVGKHIVELLLQNNNYSKIYAVSRKGIEIQHPKLIQILADFDTISQQISNTEVDVLFSCLGSTKSKTPDPKDYYQIDYQYPLRVSNILKENGCKTICLVSAIGANSESRNFYLKLKGEVERDIIEVGINNTHIFQPSLIVGKRHESRFLETLANFFMSFINPFLIGKMKKYRSIKANVIAHAMVNVSLQEKEGVYIYQSDTIKNLA